jgi:hypothetical protein
MNVALADDDDLPEDVRYAYEHAVELARAPRVPRSHLRPGLVRERVEPVRCDYGSGSHLTMQCRELATEVIRTRTTRRDYCAKHFEKVLGEVQTRTPRRLNINAIKESKTK